MALRIHFKAKAFGRSQPKSCAKWQAFKILTTWHHNRSSEAVSQPAVDSIAVLHLEAFVQIYWRWRVWGCHSGYCSVSKAMKFGESPACWSNIWPLASGSKSKWSRRRRKAQINWTRMFLHNVRICSFSELQHDVKSHARNLRLCMTKGSHDYH
jgi:hypothetical protein